MKLNWKKIWKYVSNIALLLIVLTLFIPSWRMAFQGWVHGVFMDDIALNSTESTAIPDDVKKWELFNLNGELFYLEEFQGKPTILSFWATWCVYCRPELKEIGSLKAYFGDRMNYVSVSEEHIDVIKNSGLGEDYDFLYFSPSIPDFFGVDSYPTLLILNKQQEIVYEQTGAGGLDTEENRAFFEDLIKE